MGWAYATFWILVFLGLAVAMTLRVGNRWYLRLIIGVLTLVFLQPSLAITGDISAILPDYWSEEGDGKDQIIFVSMIATVSCAAIAACLLTYLGTEVVAMWTDDKDKPMRK